MNRFVRPAQLLLLPAVLQDLFQCRDRIEFLAPPPSFAKPNYVIREKLFSER